jgi:cell division protein ZipA
MRPVRVTLVLALSTLLLGGGFLMIASRKGNAPPVATPVADEQDPRNVMLNTNEQATERASQLPGPSEDAGYLLVAPPRIGEPEVSSDGPQESIQWVLDVTAGSASTKLDPSAACGAFDTLKWSRYPNASAFVYCQSAGSGVWARADAADGPCTKVAVALDLDALHEDDYRPELFTRFLEEARLSAKKLGVVEVRPRISAVEAAARARLVSQLAHDLNDFDSSYGTAHLLVAAPEGTKFDGRAVWDVMVSLGLEWGDMDEFHWLPEGHGEEPLFSVASTVDRGFFLPERIAEGNERFGNVIFDFNIWKSPDADAVFDSMYRAAQYAGRRLGGELYVHERPVDVAAIHRHIAEVNRRLKAAGITPGSAAARRL